MKKIGDVLLPNTIQWTNQYTWSPVIQEVRMTLGGGMVILHAENYHGRPITLSADEDIAWLDKNTVAQLEAMAFMPGEQFQLIWDDLQIQVVFRHQESPALDLQRLWPEMDWWIGSIKLMSV